MVIVSVRTLLVALFLLPLICTAHDVVIERNVNLRVGPSTQTEVIKLLKASDKAAVGVGYVSAGSRSGSRNQRKLSVGQLHIRAF